MLKFILISVVLLSIGTSDTSARDVDIEKLVRDAETVVNNRIKKDMEMYTSSKNLGKRKTRKVTPASRMMQHHNTVLKEVNDRLNKSIDSTEKQEIMERASERIEMQRNINRDGSDLAEVGCNSKPIECDTNSRFRTISGICNNLNEPMWGSANVKMERFIPADYAPNGEPRGTRYSSEKGSCVLPQHFDVMTMCTSNPTKILPNPREISIRFHISKKNKASEYISHMLAQWGQFLDHDITLTPESEVDCEKSFSPECFPISLPCSEHTFNSSTHHNIEFVRSLAFCQHLTNEREQINGITAFVDASNVYGSSTVINYLLTNSGGKDMLLDQKQMLPNIEGQFMAGDIRALENPGLASLHTLWAREHNRLAKQIRSKGITDNELIFEEARRLVTAQMQNVVYGQFLTIVLGKSVMKDANLELTNDMSHYDKDMNPGIRNSFATAAFRFGHSLIQGAIQVSRKENLIDEDVTIPLRKIFFDPEIYFEENGMSGLLSGMYNQPCLNVDPDVSDDLTNHLFENLFSASDLMARNIQRGRDHGIPGYNKFRKFCGLSSVCNWSEKPQSISQSNWDKLRSLYEDPNDMDLITVGLAEESHLDGILGETFSCLITKQFQALKTGDRFFFTHELNPYPFKPQELDILLKRDLGDIICDNTDLSEVGENVFLLNSNRVKCGEHDQLDANMFL